MFELEDINATISSFKSRIFVLQKAKVEIFNKKYKTFGVEIVKTKVPTSSNNKITKDVFMVRLHPFEEEYGYAHVLTTSLILELKSLGKNIPTVYFCDKVAEKEAMFSLNDIEGVLTFALKVATKRIHGKS